MKKYLIKSISYKKPDPSNALILLGIFAWRNLSYACSGTWQNLKWNRM